MDLMLCQSQFDRLYIILIDKKYYNVSVSKLAIQISLMVDGGQSSTKCKQYPPISMKLSYYKLGIFNYSQSFALMIMKGVVTIDTYKHTNDFTLCLNQCDVGPIDIIFNIFKIKKWYTIRKKKMPLGFQIRVG